MRTFTLAVTGVVFAFAACSSYGTSVVEVPNQRTSVASVFVSVPPSLLAGQSARATATPKDANGKVLSDRPFVWSTSSPATVTVSDSGVVAAITAGNAVVSAASEGVVGQATLVVVAPSPAAVATLVVSISPASALVGQTAYATATMKDSSGNVLTGRAVTWQSSDSRVATVQATGDIQAVGAGNTMISATSGGVTNSSAFTVTAPAPLPVASVSVSPATANLQVGANTQLSAVTRDANNNVLAGRAVTWSSSDPSITAVSASGLVTAVAAGSATITALSEGQSGSSSITVVAAPVPVASVSVSLGTSSLIVPQTTQATATTRDANNNVLTGRSITWSSSNAAVATVFTSGLVTSRAAGTSQITATSEGKSGSATITVTAPSAPVASVSVSPASTSVQVGSTVQLSATTRDMNNNVLTGRVVRWSSGNATIASVDSISGLVTTKAAGSATITAKSENKTGTASIVVTAAPPPVSGSAEPSGMTTISDRPFDAVSEDGWSLWAGAGSNGNFSIASVATAPRSPSNVGQMRFPGGLIGGNEPANLGKTLPGTSRTLYVSMWLELSPNWVANSSGVSKTLHIFINGINRVYTSSQGTTTLVPQVRLQQLASNFNAMAQGGEGSGQYVNLTPNVAGQTGAQVYRGRWHKWELVLYGGSAGGADGTVDWWIDGVKVGHYTGIPFVAAGGSNTWESVIWSPTWGGMGGAVPADQFQWIDHMYISGK